MGVVVSGDAGTLSSPTLLQPFTYGATSPCLAGFLLSERAERSHSKSSQCHRWPKGRDGAIFPLQATGGMKDPTRQQDICFLLEPKGLQSYILQQRCSAKSCCLTRKNAFFFSFLFFFLKVTVESFPMMFV